MSALGGAAVSGATLDALTRVNALLRSEEYRRHRAVHLLQLAARKNTILRRHRTAATPSVAAAREYAESFLPRDPETGELYRALDMTAHCCRPRPGARATIDVFDAMGANIGLYVRVVGWGVRLFAVVTLIALVPMVHNMLGDEQYSITTTYNMTANHLVTWHTLGNSPMLKIARRARGRVAPPTAASPSSRHLARLVTRGRVDGASTRGARRRRSAGRSA